MTVEMSEEERRQAGSALRAILTRNRGKPMMWFELAYGGIESPYTDDIHRDMGQCIEDGLIIAIHLLDDPEFPTAQQAQKKWDDLEHKH